MLLVIKFLLRNTFFNSFLTVIISVCFLTLSLHSQTVHHFTIMLIGFRTVLHQDMVLYREGTMYGLDKDIAISAL